MQSIRSTACSVLRRYTIVFAGCRVKNLVPQGMSGELCLAGPQIAEGYWKQPELTAEKFVSCPFLPGEKMYRTGDLARYNEKGELEFLGRMDTQVKLRGFRIELGEIENTACKFEGLAQAVTEVRKDRLVLYYTADKGSGGSIDRDELRDFLAKSLTEYMVPSPYMELPELPVTPNGKIDRKKLLDDRRQCGETKKDVAELYMSLLDMVIPEGRRVYLFEGHSFGGVLAYHSAVLWEEMRGYAAPVVMIDSYIINVACIMAKPETGETTDIPEALLKTMELREEAFQIAGKLDDGREVLFYTGEVTLYQAIETEPGFDAYPDKEIFNREMEENEHLWKNRVRDLHVVPIHAGHFSIIERIGREEK